MKQLLALIICSVAMAPRTQAADENPIRLKVLGRQSLVGTQLCTGLGSNAEAMKKYSKLQEKRNSLSYWLSGKTAVNPKFHKLFKNDPVSYIVTFDGKSDTGTLRLAQHASPEAQCAALLSLRRILPLSSPPNDLPYQRGLLIRFDSTGMTIHLAPRPFV